MFNKEIRLLILFCKLYIQNIWYILLEVIDMRPGSIGANFFYL